MAGEKEINKKISELEEKKDVKGLEELKAEAEASFEGDLAGQAEQAINRLTKKVEEITPVVDSVENKKDQVENLGGDENSLKETIKPIDTEIAKKDEEIEKVQVGTEQQINAIKAEISEEPIKNSEADLIKEKEEKIKKFNEEMKGLLDQVVGRMPEKMKEYYNSAEYNKLLELNNKKNAEEKSLFEAYDRITKGNDEHRRGFSIGRGSAHYYLNDLKFANASADIVKRFEEFDDKIAKPTFDAEWPAELKMRETLNNDRWVFEKSLQSKVDENFKDDPKGREEAYKKWSEEYHNNFNKIKGEVVPDKPAHVNTMGTIFS